MAEPDVLPEDDANPFFADEDLDQDDTPEPDPPAGPTADELAQLRSQAQIVQRFNSDPAFARQIVRERAQQLGLVVQETQPTPPANAGPPADYVETVRASLSPEMQFLAPQIAGATWTATQSALEPVRQQQQAHARQQRESGYQAMSRDLSSEAPGWEKYEDDMLGILGFLRGVVEGSGSMTHPKYGSALKLLYRLASGDAAATAQAGRRMQQALRSGTRTSTGGGRGQGPDLQTMLEKATTDQQRWQIAYRHALREHGVVG